MVELAAHWHIAIILCVTLVAIVLFATEILEIETTALAVIAALLALYHIFPVITPEGEQVLTPRGLLSGFASPSLVAILALLVIGQAMVQTDALYPLASRMVKGVKSAPALVLTLSLTGVMLLSGLLNNTPLVIMAIPIVQSLAERMDQSASRLMMPLSFAAILGGMTTLLGSSTNLLVSQALVAQGHEPLSFFDPTPIGLILAGVGLLYVFAVLPALLPERASLSDALTGRGKQFIAEIKITTSSPLAGKSPNQGFFPGLEEVTLRLIQRGRTVMLPPFDDYTAEAGDILIVAATRQSIVDLLSANTGFVLHSNRVQEDAEALEADIRAGKQEAGEAQTPSATVPKGGPGRRPFVLSEVMVAPASRLIDLPLDQIDFTGTTGCEILGIQRRARMVRGRMGDIRLMAGDILLVVGHEEQVNQLRDTRDVVQMAWATRAVPMRKKAPVTAAIFLAVVSSAAVGLFPIATAAVVGAVALILTGSLNIRQASRAVDRKIILLIAAALALARAMDKTGAASWMAHGVTGLAEGYPPLVMIAVLFGIVALMTNVLSNNACAVLFTPISVQLAGPLGIDPTVMAMTVLFAANCSFASPIGYQTNLLVMGPGQYKFRDFMRGGGPLILLMWATYCGLMAIWL